MTFYLIYKVFCIMKQYWIIYLFLCCATLIHAQSTLNGKIVDERQNGIPDVTIQLLQTDSTFIKGTITDSIGNYRLQDIKMGDYLLYISSIGFISQKIPIKITTQKKMCLRFT